MRLLEDNLINFLSDMNSCLENFETQDYLIKLHFKSENAIFI